ncbi:MAG TPA: Xaa-Pro aminopeptidase [Gammaproteobacteria bacterium]|jgi:Xaa-Pro aminopeptidase|nr:Xaa-Pro aminopeptidase [Gammaproteobacteria bacterium]
MKDYAERRKKLMTTIGSHGIAIFPSAHEQVRNGDAEYAFRQQSDFYYLSGFSEPESIIVLAPKRPEGEFILFNRVRDAESEAWDGPRVGQVDAVKLFGADQAFPITEFEAMLPALLSGRQFVYYGLGLDAVSEKMLIEQVNRLRSKVRQGLEAPLSFIDPMPIVHDMRLFKNAAEIQLIQKAVDISADAHIRAMSCCRPGMYEYELEAELMHAFLSKGARSPAYGNIVGAGENSCILHYATNNRLIKSGDMVLIDAGAEYENYAADITRTFPANGKFSAEQRAIYDIVLAAQDAAIQAIKPGISWTKAQDEIVNVITQGLIDLKILKGNIQTLIEKQAYLPFYRHRSGHWLGLDVHDAGAYQVNGEWRLLESGMVLTVEPGLYMASNIPGLDAKWHHIGVRIEDDLLVTETGHQVLSQHIPKTIADIETVMAKHGG